MGTSSKTPYIVDVIPIARGIGKESLSYFTTLDLPLGALVSIPMRKRTVDAIVIGKREGADLRSQIRSAYYAIRKNKNLKLRKLKAVMLKVR